MVFADAVFQAMPDTKLGMVALEMSREASRQVLAGPLRLRWKILIVNQQAHLIASR